MLHRRALEDDCDAEIEADIGVLLDAGVCMRVSVCVDLVRFYFVDTARSSGSHSSSWQFLPSTDV